MSTQQLTREEKQYLAPLPSNIRNYSVTGTFNGSIVAASSEGEARRIFHKHYNGESILTVHLHGRPYIDKLQTN